jgi:hypothetical protein
MPGHSHGNAIIKTAIETETETETETPPKNLEKRKGDFVADVEKYTEYDLAMRSEFVTYWTEPNRSGKKMRFELERTWLLSGRLATWEKKAEQFSSRKRYGRQEVSMQELRDQAARIKLS